MVFFFSTIFNKKKNLCVKEIEHEINCNSLFFINWLNGPWFVVPIERFPCQTRGLWKIWIFMRYIGQIDTHLFFNISHLKPNYGRSHLHLICLTPKLSIFLLVRILLAGPQPMSPMVSSFSIFELNLKENKKFLLNPFYKYIILIQLNVNLTFINLYFVATLGFGLHRCTT